MGLFKKKQNTEVVEFEKNLSWMQRQARNKILNDIDKSIRGAIKEKRLVFKSDGSIDYTDRTGKHEVYNDDEFASEMWRIHDKKLNEASSFGMVAGLALLAIIEADIRGIIQKIKGG